LLRASKKEMPLKIFREKPSAYFPLDFVEREEALFNQLGLKILTSFSECDVFISNTHTDWNKLDGKNPSLKLVIHPNSGFDNFPLSLVQKMACPIILGNPIRARSVADWSLRCFTSLLTPPPFVSKWDKNRNWNRQLIEGKSILILGLGHVGSILKSALESFYGPVQCYDSEKGHSRPPDWSQAKYVFVCASLTTTSLHLIDNSVLKQLPPDFTLINPARGEIIILPDLLGEITKRKIQGENCQVFLDVYPQEPYALDLLATTGMIKTSCHIAGVDQNLAQRTLDFEKEVLMDYLILKSDDFAQRWRSLNLKERPSQEFVHRQS
jgi:D-3-phosphoglycerate dehydrogenase